jgi:hypothetical protein
MKHVFIYNQVFEKKIHQDCLIVEERNSFVALCSWPTPLEDAPLCQQLSLKFNFADLQVLTRTELRAQSSSRLSLTLAGSFSRREDAAQTECDLCDAYGSICLPGHNFCSYVPWSSGGHKTSRVSGIIPRAAGGSRSNAPTWSCQCPKARECYAEVRSLSVFSSITDISIEQSSEMQLGKFCIQ